MKIEKLKSLRIKSQKRLRKSITVKMLFIITPIILYN